VASTTVVLLLQLKTAPGLNSHPTALLNAAHTPTSPSTVELNTVAQEQAIHGLPTGKLVVQIPMFIMMLEPPDVVILQ
jgi:hypothetical protein